MKNLLASLFVFSIFFISFSLFFPLSAKLVRQTIDYKDGSATLESYYVYDDAYTGRRPGVLVAHDWMGLGDFSKARADQLAGMGYPALAVDIYGKAQRPKDQEEAAQFAGKYKGDRKLMRSRMNAGLKFIQNQKQVDPSKIAVIGYCFGGTAALELARSGAPITGAVSFHGGLGSPTPQDAKKIQGKILALHGADDPYVPLAEVSAFEKEMRDAKVDWQLVSYGNAVHAFTNPAAGNDNSKGAAYNQKADHRSWEEMIRFFREIFGA